MSSKWGLGLGILGGLYSSVLMYQAFSHEEKATDTDEKEAKPENCGDNYDEKQIDADTFTEKFNDTLKITFPDPSTVSQISAHADISSYDDFNKFFNDSINKCAEAYALNSMRNKLTLMKEYKITVEFCRAAGKIKKWALNKTDPPHIVFIHGFNNNKQQIDDRVEFIEKQIGSGAVKVSHFKWPSAESVRKYYTDKKIADFYSHYLFRYLDDIIQSANISKLYIMAHSMGNDLLNKALISHIKTTMVETGKSIFTKLKDCQIISIAADYDRTKCMRLVEELMDPEKIKIYGINKWTHYFNDYDKVLKISEKMNNWKYGAAGRYKIQNYYHTVVSIDCSNYSYYSDTNHSYIDSIELFKDITLMIKYELDEYQRDTIDLVCNITNEFKLKGKKNMIDLPEIPEAKSNAENDNVEIVAEWNTDVYGEGISFINRRIARLNKKIRMAAMCFLNCALFPQENINKFDLYLKITSGEKLAVTVGFAEGIHDIPKNELNGSFGMNQIGYTTTGIVITNEANQLILWNRNNHGKRLKYKGTFKSNDIFIASFDFNNDKLQMYHNGNKADSVSLNGFKRVVTGVSIWETNNAVEILKCVAQFDK